MLADKITVTQSELKDEYKSQPDRFNKPARRIIDRIIFDSVETARTIKDQLDKEEISFTKVAEDRGLTQTDIDLGDIEKGQLDKDIDDLLFNATEVGIYGPVDTNLGPALFSNKCYYRSAKY